MDRFRCAVGVWLVVLLAGGEWAAVTPAPMVPATPDILVFPVGDTDGDGEENLAPFVPLTPFCEITGATLTREAEGVLRVTREGYRFRCAVGKREASDAAGTILRMSAAPFLFDGEPYVPAPSLIAALGGEVRVAKDARSIIVTLPGLARPLNMACWLLETPPDQWKNPATEMYVVAIDGTGLRRLSYTNWDESEISLSPDGATLLYEREGNIYLRALNDPRERVLLASDKKIYFYTPAFSPDGTQVAYVQRTLKGASKIGIINVDGTKRRLLTAGEEPVWNPNGRQLAYTERSSNDDLAKLTVYLIDTTGRHRRRVGKGYFPEFSPDGARLCCTWNYSDDLSDFDIHLIVYTLAGKDAGTIAEFPRGTSAGDTHIDGDFHPNGHLIAYRESVNICVCAPDLTQRRALFTEICVNGGPDFTPDGRSLLFQEANVEDMVASELRALRCRLALVPVAGGPVRYLTNWDVVPYIRDVCFSPDGRRVFFTATKFDALAK
ncbi:MAG: stalk domain-containing protein [Armatimonadota bacterium]